MSMPHPYRDLDRLVNDLDRLTPAAYDTVLMLVGLREGRTMNEFAERLTDVVDGVITEAQVNDDTGKVTGPAGTVTFTLRVVPNETRPDKFVKIVEKLAHNKPEDRSHVLFVGKGSTVHTRDPHTHRAQALFSVEPAGTNVTTIVPNPEVASPFTPPDTDGSGDGEGPQGTTGDDRLPYKDN